MTSSFIFNGETLTELGYPPGFLFGLTLSNNVTDATNDIDIAVGKCRDSTAAQNMVLASALTKRLDAAWVVGTNQGGLDTGAVGNNTYHVWLIKRPDTGVVDVLFSLSASAPTMPTSYTFKRRIGSIVRLAGVNKPFVQDGDKFMWKVPVNDLSVLNPGTAAVTRTLTVPVGVRVEAIITVTGGAATSADNAQGIIITDLSQTDTAPTFPLHRMYSFSNSASSFWSSVSDMLVFTNISAQVRSRLEVSATNTRLVINTHGWIDTRGRLS